MFGVLLHGALAPGEHKLDHLGLERRRGLRAGHALRDDWVDVGQSLRANLRPTRRVSTAMGVASQA
eukprot:87199-Lingulodinium_polyedra.AAC.2